MRERKRGSTIRLGICALAALVPLGACSSNQLGAPALDGGNHPRGILLTVQNHNVQDARVYLVRPGLRVRVATLGTNESRSVSLPSGLVGIGAAFKLEADLIGSGERHRSDWVTVGDGDELNWVIAHRPALSHLAVTR